MKLRKAISILITICFALFGLEAQVSGVFQTEKYLPILKDNRVALVVNHSSRVNNVHLLDTLLSLGVNVECVFAPEHGFSGNFNAGEYFDDVLYNDTIPIYSLYSNKEIQDAHVENIDIIVFDIQDVGVRFYTYISTLHYVMEGCARNNIELLVLDRPNPHVNYVDGPVLNPIHKSFVGMHPVPIVYGMTIGEYALMINGEGWLNNNLICDLTVLPNANYNRSTLFDVNDAPSPNLRNLNSILLYPSLCLFEGTLVSVGRGTNYPFEIFGAPFFKTNFIFLPQPNFGAKNPKYNNEHCYGYDLRNSHTLNSGIFLNKINLAFLIQAYQETPSDKKNIFFNSFFNKLAGNEQLKQQIINGLSEDKIRSSWKLDLKKFKKVRKKYLLYN